MRRTATCFIVVLTLAGCSADPDPRTVAQGEKIYAAHCASCHGANLEGQPNWKQKLPNGKWPAPPHDDSGHTWHHSDKWLFHVVERGMTPPPGRHDYESDMPAFGEKLSDGEIRAVLAFVKSRWSDETHEKRDDMLSSRRARSREPWRAFQKHP